METVEYMWVNIWCMLIAQDKIPECEGSISPSSFYGQLPHYLPHVLATVLST